MAFPSIEGDTFWFLEIKMRTLYPRQYEIKIVIEGIGDVLIRPITSEDAPLLLDLFDALSYESRYFRFFSPMKRLSQNLLSYFTQIDYGREIALVAIQEKNGYERMLGVARAYLDCEGKSAELSVTVGDQWQGKGLGTALVRHVLTIAKERKIEKIVSSVLTENTKMLGLGEKMGMNISLEPGKLGYELSLNLQ